jgi:hypothetical protein
LDQENATSAREIEQYPETGIRFDAGSLGLPQPGRFQQHDEDEWRQESRQAYDGASEYLLSHYCFILRPLLRARAGGVSGRLQGRLDVAQISRRQRRSPGGTFSHLHELSPELRQHIQKKRAGARA